MNVENRKLFRNKDARSRLSDMGGIIASSPELLGEVQKFKTGTRNGEVVEANSLMAQLGDAVIEHSIAGVYGPDVQTTFIGRAIAGGFGPEVQDDTMNKALAGEFGEDIKAKAETLSPIYNAEVPPIIEETPPVLSQPSVQPNTFSSESMMNEQAPRPTGPKFSAFGNVVPSEMPLVEGPGPAPAFPMNTAADSTDPLGVLTNPRTGEPMTLLPPGERSPQVLDSRSGIRTLLDRYILGDKTGRRADPQVATESPGFMDSDEGSVMGFSPEISPEVAQELKMLEDLRTARNINAPQGTVEGLKTAGADLLEVGNIAMGVPMYVGGQAVAGAADLAGYLGGGGKFSRSMFGFSDDMQDKTNELFLPEGTPGGIPRLYSPDPTSAYSQRLNPLTMEALNQLSSEELAAQRALIQAESLAAIENADSSVLSEGAPTELTPAGRAQRAADSVTRMSEQGMPKGLSPEAIARIQEQQAQEAAEKEMDAAGRRLIAGQPREVGPVEVQPEVDDRNLLEKGIDRFKANMAARSDAESLEDLKTTAVEASSTNLTPEKIEEINAKILAEKENTIIAEEVKPEDIDAAMAIADKEAQAAADSTTRTGTGTDTSGSGDGTGKTSGSKDKPTSLYADYKKEILAALGGEKKDKNKEKWEDFSLAMFRIAAGKDPSAVANIAAGLAESAADKKADRSLQQERDDRINMLALKMSQEEKLAGLRAGSIYEKIPTFSEAVLDEMTSIRSSQGPISVPITESELRDQALKTVGSLPAYSGEYKKYLTTTTDGNKQQYL